jgi:F-type H+-transporting ATPase subunit epsilon
METMKIDLVSPERRLASVDADGAQIPGVEGDLTALPGHAPFLITLRPGLVTILSSEGKREYFVTGGFAEISGEQASILAEEAVARADLTRDWIEAKIADAAAAVEAASDDSRTALSQRANDFRFALSHLDL